MLACAINWTLIEIDQMKLRKLEFEKMNFVEKIVSYILVIKFD